MTDYFAWQVRNLLGLRGMELVVFWGLVASGLGLYYSIKTALRGCFDRRNSLAGNLKSNCHEFSPSPLPRSVSDTLYGAADSSGLTA